MKNIMKQKTILAGSLIYFILFFSIYGYSICSENKILSEMDAKQLKELGKQALALNEYSEAIKIYNQIKKKYPNDPIYTVQGELLKSITDPTTFTEITTLANQTTFTYQTTLAFTKIRCDAELIANCDVPNEIIDLLNRLSKKYEMLGDYEKAIGIIKEIRKIYVDEPWTKDMFEKMTVNKTQKKPQLTREAMSTYFDIKTRFQIAELLGRQGKRIEAKKQYLTLRNLIHDDKFMEKVSPDDMRDIRNDIDKEVADRLNELQ